MKFVDSVTRSFLEYSSPSMRQASASISRFVDYQDPTYIGFYIRFPQLGTDGTGEKFRDDAAKDYDSFPGGLLYNAEHPDSAQFYLKNIGEFTRAKMVEELIMLLYQLQKMPWYMKKVSGLEDLWKIDPAQNYRGKDKKLVIEMLESIDMKTTYLLDLYRKAAYDVQHMRWMLPPNLRVFDMELVITEVRSFHTPKKLQGNKEVATSFENPIEPSALENIDIPGLTAQGIQNAVSGMVPNTQWAAGLSRALIGTFQSAPGSYEEYPVEMVNFNESATFLNFNFSKCYFDIKEDAPTYFGSLAKIPEAEAANKLTIFTPVVKETNSYGLLNAILEDTYDQSSRSEDAAKQYFDSNKKWGKDVLSGTTREDFLEDSKRKSNQAKIREENNRAFGGGLLGNLAEEALQIGANILDDAVKGVVSRAILGNVFGRAFPSPIAQGIAETVLLETPQIIKTALTTVALESNGINIDETISPTVVKFADVSVANPVTAAVNFIAPIITAPSTQNVLLEAATISQSIPLSVNLSGAVVNANGDQSVQLSGPTVGPLLASEVIFTDLPNAQLQNTAVSLSSFEASNASPGTVKFNEIPIGKQESSKVSLESSNVASNTLNNAAVDFNVVESDSNVNVGAVALKVPLINTGIPHTVSFESNPASNENPGHVNLVGPTIPPPTNVSIDLTAPATELKNNVGTVSLDGNIIPMAPLSPIEFTGIKTRDSALSSIQFEGPTILNTDITNVDLIEAPKSSLGLSNIDFEESAISISIPQKVVFQEVKSTPTDLKNVPQNGPIIQQIKPDTINFTGAANKQTNPGSVLLKETPVSSESLGTIIQKAPRIDNTELNKINFEGAEQKMVEDLGTLPLESPPTNAADTTNSVSMESPPDSQAINNLGNADLKAP